jgi:hypothetical protein
MACTIAVTRRGLHRSLVRTFQVLRVALARSPMARMRAVSPVDLLLPTRQFRPVAVAFERCPDTAPGALIGLVGERHHVLPAQRLDDAVGAGRSQLMGRAGQSR